MYNNKKSNQNEKDKNLCLKDKFRQSERKSRS